jgi:plasmid stabilization system protein ParE
VKPRAFHPEADEEYAEAAEYYARIRPELGRRFYDQIEGLILDIRRQPRRFRLFDPPIRRHFSSVFPYAVLYVDQPDRVLIIAVMHMKRQVGYWKHRLG